MTTKKTQSAGESPAVYSVAKNQALPDSNSHACPILNNESGTFYKRLKEVIGDEPQRAFARRCVISESVMRGYLSGTKKPGLDALLSISNAASVTIDWLATGCLPKFRAELRNTKPVVPLSQERLRLALTITEDAATVQPLSPEQRADMVLSVYNRLTKGDAS